MSELLSRFSFQAAKFDAQVIICLLMIWGVVLWCVGSSILSQPFTKRQRFFWFVVVVGVPLLGILAYLPFSFRREDLPHAFLMKQKGRQKKGLGRDRNQTGESRA